MKIGLYKPRVVFVESPMGCQLAPHFFRQLGKEDGLDKFDFLEEI
jgi:hypothetical protein